MRRRTTALAVLAVLALAACGDAADEATSTGPGRGAQGFDVEVVHLGEGVPPLDGPPAVRELDPDDPEAAAELFVEAELDAVVAALDEADLDGRTLLGGLVHEGCFAAGGVSVEVADGAVTFRAEDLDPQEDEVDCARAVVTTALVSVPTEQLPDPGAPAPGSGDPHGPAIEGEQVLLEPIPYEDPEVAGPGLVRDPVDLHALFGGHGLGQPDGALLDRVERGDEVLVAARVGGSCTLPIEVTLRRTGTDLVVDERHDPEDEDLVCDAVVQGLVLVAVAAADVEGVETVAGDPADGPTGVGETRAVEPVDVAAEPLAARWDEVDLAAVPGAPTEAALALPPVADGAVRLVFVVGACEPGTAELVADLDAGTVRAEPQQVGDRIECDALSPHLVVADLAEPHAALEPVT